MTACKACSGDGYKLVGDKTIPSDCSSCISESLIKMGIFTKARAILQCSCMANNHKGEIKIETSKELIKVVDESKENQRVDEEERAKIPNIFEEKAAEAKAYYIKRVAQLKLLDEESESKDGVPYHG